MSDWDAGKYHRLSEPQREWGLRVLERLDPQRGEKILDIGCGTGRLTSEIGRRAPSADVFAMDRSRAMLTEARSHVRAAAEFLQADGARLPFRDRTFHAVFSTATFHWIGDHEALFAEIHRVLTPGGRLVSQCGGGPNLQRLYDRARQLRSAEAYTDHFGGWTDPWNFASAEQTEARMRRAGFVDVEVSLEPAQTPFPDIPAYEAFVTTVCLRDDLERLPAAQRQPFVHECAVAAAGDDPPLTLDYWRLNADGRRRS